MHNILAIIENGFEELEAIGTIALLRRSGLHVCIATPNQTNATGRFALTLDDLTPLEEVNAQEYDVLLIPGGPHYQALESNQDIKTIIKNFMEQDKTVAAICAAPTILGRMGLLKGRHYTCFTSMDEDFQGTYVDAYTCVDKNLITARSAAASIDFAFEIIKKVQGEAQAECIKQQIYYEKKV